MSCYTAPYSTGATIRARVALPFQVTTGFQEAPAGPGYPSLSTDPCQLRRWTAERLQSSNIRLQARLGQSRMYVAPLQATSGLEQDAGKDVPEGPPLANGQPRKRAFKKVDKDAMECGALIAVYAFCKWTIAIRF